jgi:tRNA(Ile)-lysidine synthase
MLPIDASILRPGMRLAIGLSGGADSVALLRALEERSRELGIVPHAVHLHHGLRGAEADADLVFCKTLADQLHIPFHHAQVETTVEALPTSDKPSESIEEAARRVRYRWFRDLLSKVPLDAIATAHTLDDQAETVLAKFLRGAWTEGLSGIHPILKYPEGLILRPLLAVPRAEIEIYLRTLNQPWREDSTNRHLTFTRNRIRHELLPLLDTWNPRLREHLAHMASLARDEDAWWQVELDRLSPQLILPGLPARGGGRAASEGLALDIVRFAQIPIAMQRRLLRHAAAQLGAAPDFAATESLRDLALTGRAGQKLELAHQLLAERTHRELRLTSGSIGAAEIKSTKVTAEYLLSIPCEVEAPAFDLRLSLAFSPSASALSDQPRTALLRPWKPGDRVRIRHSTRPRKVKEVLEKIKVTGSDRIGWPVLEYNGRILWMQGIELEPEPGISVCATTLTTHEPSSL